MGHQPDLKSHELVQGLGNESLLDLSQACFNELSSRGIEIPAEAGKIVIPAIDRVRSTLINPFETEEPLEPSVLADGRLIIDHADKKVIRDKRVISVGESPFLTLSVLAVNHDRPVSIDYLASTVWPDIDVHVRTVSSNIVRLRQHLGVDLGNKKTGVVRSIRGEGWLAASSLAD